jgi:hypothetical protein
MEAAMLRRLSTLATLSLLASFTIAHADITTGLIARYPFDGNANDISGYANNGSLVGGITLTTDRFGIANRAYSFNGTDSYILIPDSPSLDTPTTAVTQAAWIYVYGPSNVGEHYNPLIMKSNSPINEFMYRMIADPSYLGMSVNSWGNSQSVGIVMPLNTWHHVASVYSNSTVTFYYDGANIGTQPMYFTIFGDHNPLTIGADFPGILEIFNGKIDDVCIYNRALSDADILELKNQATPTAVAATTPRFSVREAVPNPSSGESSVEYDLAAPGHVEISVYDVAGHRVREIESGVRGAGPHVARWDGREDSGVSAPSGVYFFRLTDASEVLTARLVRVR